MPINEDGKVLKPLARSWFHLEMGLTRLHFQIFDGKAFDSANPARLVHNINCKLCALLHNPTVKYANSNMKNLSKKQ